MYEWIILILVLVPQAIGFYYIDKMFNNGDISAIMCEILMLLVVIGGTCFCIALNYSGWF